SAAGPIVGGLLTGSLSWRWIFFVNLPICAAALILALAALPHATGRSRDRIDLAGIAAFTVSAAALTYALTGTAAVGWTAASTLGLFGLAAAAASVFVRI